MGLLIRDYSITDEDVVASWFLEHWSKPMPVHALPQRGYVAEKYGMMVAAIWMYVSDSRELALVGWPVSNPNAEPILVAMALQQLVRLCKKKACDMGVSVLSSYASDSRLVKLFEHSGFIRGDQGVTNMLCSIGE